MWVLDSLETSPSDNSPSFFFRLAGFGEGVLEEEEEEDEEEEDEDELVRLLFLVLGRGRGGGDGGGGDPMLPDMTELLLSLMGEYSGRWGSEETRSAEDPRDRDPESCGSS